MHSFFFPLVYILYLRLAAASDKVYSYLPMVGGSLRILLVLKCEPYPLASQIFYPHTPQFNARQFDRMLLILRWWFEIMIAFNADDFLDNIAKIWRRLVIIFNFDHPRHTLQNCSPIYRTNNVGKMGSTSLEMNLVFRSISHIF